MAKSYYYYDLPTLSTLTPGSEHEVSIAVVHSPTKFFVHPIKFRGVLDTVNVRCNIYGNRRGGVPIDEKYLKDGILCISKYEEKWFRSVVIDVDQVGKNCYLFFLDYGNGDLVDFKNILPIEHSLLLPPIQCLYVLATSAFTEEELESFSDDVTILNMKITKRLRTATEPWEMMDLNPTHEIRLTLLGEMNENEREAPKDCVPKEALAFMKEMRNFAAEMEEVSMELLSSRDEAKQEIEDMKESLAALVGKLDELELKHECTASQLSQLETRVDQFSHNLENSISEQVRTKAAGLLVPMRVEIRALEEGVSSMGNLEQHLLTLAGKLDSETLSFRNQIEEIKSKKSEQEELVPPLLASLRERDELLDKMLREKVEEKERTDKAISELRAQIDVRAINPT